MGLTIHYTLSLPSGGRISGLHELLNATARLAHRIGCAHVGKVLHSTETDPTAVKTQIWVATTVYLMVASLHKQMSLPGPLP